MGIKNRIIAHIDMNSYFASVEQAADPRLKGRPVAVGGGIGKRTVIATSSYEARARGVKTGMPAWEALKKCPALLIIAGDMDKYIYTTRQIVKIFKRYTGLVEVFSIDEAFLDLSAECPDLAGASEICRKIKSDIKQGFGLTCSIGLGPNKLIAKLASDMQKPDGLVAIEEKEIPLILEFTAVDALCGIGRRTKKKLNSIGVKTCGGLSKVPLEALISSFGSVYGRRLFEMSRGIDISHVDPLKELADPKSISHSYTLPADEPDPEKAKQTLFVLCAKVAARARAGGYRGSTVSACARYSDHSMSGGQKKLEEYIDDGTRIYDTALRMIDPRGHVRFFGVALSSLVKGCDQISLLSGEENSKAAVRAMDKVNSKYGPGTVSKGFISSGLLTAKCGMAEKTALSGI